MLKTFNQLLFFKRIAKRQTRWYYPFILLVSFTLLSNTIFAQTTNYLLSQDLKKLSLEELMNIEVTSVSKQAEKLTETASAIQVITQDDIRRSGATSLPEALRLASNLQVAQVNSSQWAISARGFTNVLSNKLLVLVDGRAIYTPMYAGVFWDAQTMIMEDIDRIEVISGPGGTLWGANAVNGVINIITKNTSKTQGLFAEVAAGTELLSFGSLRYGGEITDNLTYRFYGKAFKRGNTLLNDGSEAHDSWSMGKGGFRLDWNLKENDVLTLQSDYFSGNPDPEGGLPVTSQGGNILGRWIHTVSDKANFQLQAYYDQTFRDFGNGFKENLKTYDLDFQRRVQLGQRNDIVWGTGLRVLNQEMQNLPLFGFRPKNKILHVYNLYIQDNIRLIKERLSLTLGSKLEHNNYTGFQIQPNARLSWTPTRSQTVWAAVSRAVRNPARIDRDFYANLTPEIAVLQGSERFTSETLVAYELGWRTQPFKNLSLSLATFYNFYDNIRSAEPGPPPLGFPITFANGVRGETYGMEVSGTYQLNEWWRLRGGYTALGKELSIKPSSADLNGASAESNDPKHQFLLQSSLDIPGNLEFSTVIRYIDKLPKPHVRGYVGLDVRLAWEINKVLELNIVGQNLVDERHTEFIPESPSARKIQRSIYGKILCRF